MQQLAGIYCTAAVEANFPHERILVKAEGEESQVNDFLINGGLQGGEGRGGRGGGGGQTLALGRRKEGAGTWKREIVACCRNYPTSAECIEISMSHT